MPKSAAKEIASSCIAVRMRSINRAITQIYDNALRPTGLKATQLNVLVAIEAFPDSSPGVIAKALVLEKSTLSRNVDKMCQNGWIDRVGGPGPGQTLSATAVGRQLIDEALPRWRKAQREVKALLGKQAVDAVGNMHQQLLADRH